MKDYNVKKHYDTKQANTYKMAKGLFKIIPM